MAIINFECKKCNRIFDCETGEITFGNILDFEKDIICPDCGKLAKEEILLTEYGQTQISGLYSKGEPLIKGYGIYEGLFSDNNLKKELKDFIGKDTRELCDYLGFNYYIEVKDFFHLLKRTPNKHEDIVNALFEFINNSSAKVIKCYNEKIQKYIDMDLKKIKENALLFGEDKGDFYYNDPYICFCILGKDFFAYILNTMIFFYGTKESVEKMAQNYNKYSVIYHEPYELEKYIPSDYPANEEEDNEESEEENECQNEKESAVIPKKIGRNEPCPCGSGKKYKKCCLKL